MQEAVILLFSLFVVSPRPVRLRVESFPLFFLFLFKLWLSNLLSCMSFAVAAEVLLQLYRAKQNWFAIRRRFLQWRKCYSICPLWFSSFPPFYPKLAAGSRWDISIFQLSPFFSTPRSKNNVWCKFRYTGNKIRLMWHIHTNSHIKHRGACSLDRPRKDFSLASEKIIPNQL